MLNPKIMKIITDAQKAGWVVEPLAKQILQLSGIDIAPYGTVKTLSDARKLALKLGYPLAAKVVSAKIMHKSDLGGVVLGIRDDDHLSRTLNQFQSMDGFEAMHLEAMASGIELILGAQNDVQFGPVLLLGMGGTGVEIYRDVALRMAPITSEDVFSMLGNLKARKVFEGYRGQGPINTDALVALMLSFSEMVMTLQAYFDSIDLNPILCDSDGCNVADARIVLKTQAR